MDMANEEGIMGLSLGVFNLTSAGISVGLLMAFLLAVFFKPRN